MAPLWLESFLSVHSVGGDVILCTQHSQQERVPLSIFYNYDRQMKPLQAETRLTWYSSPHPRGDISPFCVGFQLGRIEGSQQFYHFLHHLLFETLI